MFFGTGTINRLGTYEGPAFNLQNICLKAITLYFNEKVYSNKGRTFCQRDEVAALEILQPETNVPDVPAGEYRIQLPAGTQNSPGQRTSHEKPADTDREDEHSGSFYRSMVPACSVYRTVEQIGGSLRE